MTGRDLAPALRRLLRGALWVAYPLLRTYWFLARPRLRGVQCVLTRGREVLLVRHTYGDRRRWELPGGGVKHGEQPAQAATREVREELGLEIAQWRPLGDVAARIDHRLGALSCFTAEIAGLEPRIDEVEIAQAAWFDRDALPQRLGERVERIVALAETRP